MVSFGEGSVRVERRALFAKCLSILMRPVLLVVGRAILPPRENDNGAAFAEYR